MEAIVAYLLVCMCVGSVLTIVWAIAMPIIRWAGKPAEPTTHKRTH